ncbi:site-specific integrase [Azospirillum halopraeferens]|uniref:site-specific integrase n=1 Tax=Azospirillum halopraeferens TaxID=34010 RepID=UPI0006840CA8|nr:site-specific integrase [Azospirillum halopraeferens]
MSIPVCMRKAAGLGALPTEALDSGASEAPLSEPLRRLQEHAAAARGAFAPATERAVRSDISAFRRWCVGMGAAFFPAAPATVAAYVDATAPRYAVATLRRHLSSVARLHRAGGLDDPTKAEAVRLALRRAARAKRTRPRQAAAITERVLDRLFEAIPMATLADLRDRALLLAGRDLLARRSELVSLDVENVQPQDDGSALVLIARSKTDQEGQGVLLWLSPPTVEALFTWLEAAGITSGALFRRVHKGGRSVGNRLSGDAVAAICKRRARAAGLDPGGFSGHSCRVGMAHDLAAAGVELPALMQAGRWRSPDMPARYIERVTAGRGAVARYHRQQPPSARTARPTPP